jgi:hypothetical protein
VNDDEGSETTMPVRMTRALRRNLTPTREIDRDEESAGWRVRLVAYEDGTVHERILRENWGETCDHIRR